MVLMLKLTANGKSGSSLHPVQGKAQRFNKYGVWEKFDPLEFHYDSCDLLLERQ